MRSTVRVLTIAALAASCSALVAHPSVRVGMPSVVAASPAARAVAPQMMFGRGGRSFVRSIKMRAPSPRFPNFGLGKGGFRGGGINGCDGGGGGDGNEATPAPDDDGKGDNPLAKAWKNYNELLEEKHDTRMSEMMSSVALARVLRAVATCTTIFSCVCP